MATSILKKIYQNPFKNEFNGIFQISFYKIFILFASAAYLLRYRKALNFSKKYILERRLEILRKRKSVFVFANGPSLGDIDLKKINALCESGKFDLISINSFLSQSAHIVKPTFAVFADNVHFRGGNDQYSKDLATCHELLIPYFVPAKHYASTRGERYAYCGFCDLLSSNTSDLSRPVGYYGVTAFFALSLAKMLGYENIYICGFDNSYFKDFHVNDDGKMIILHRHYYDGEQENTEVPCLYNSTSEFFYDVYKHFYFLEKIICSADNIFNIAKRTYMSFTSKNNNLDVYIDK